MGGEWFLEAEYGMCGERLRATATDIFFDDEMRCS